MKHCQFFMVAFLVCASATSAHASNCHVDYFNFVFGSDTSTHAVVKSGTTCSSNFRVRGGGINALSVKKQPQHGIVGTSGNNYWAYKSNTGYVGKDDYVIEISGETLGRRMSRGTTDISVAVDVVP